MIKPALIFFLLASLSLLLTACNSVRIDPQPAGSGSITVHQSSWKSATGTDNQIEATTSPNTDTQLGLK